MSSDSRPLSPHLQVYRRTYTMALSILHRVTGLGLTLGFVLLTLWLLALAAGPGAYDDFGALAASVPGRLVLAGFACAFWYHFCAGIRHLVFDTGRSLERREARRSSVIVVLAAVLLSLLSLLAIVGAGGAP
jgi:succinate dehydrogenase / fumarate reductase, cytochrome b subunit